MKNGSCVCVSGRGGDHGVSGNTEREWVNTEERIEGNTEREKRSGRRKTDGPGREKEGGK